MTLKCILVPIAGTGADAATTLTALTVARDFGAQIEVLFARPSMDDIGVLKGRGIDPSARDQILASLREQTEKDELSAREHFQSLLQAIEVEAAGAVTAVFDIVDGAAGDAVIERGAVYDLLVVAHPDGRGDESSRETVEAALFHTGRPVLLAPATRPAAVGRNVVIGWNRSAQAGRAVASAMSILERADRVTICYVDTGAKAGPSPGRLRRYLELHGIPAELVERVPDDRPIGEILLGEARDAGADLLVIGAYSHSRLRERILGGVTQHVFATPDMPILMAR